jgi:hypothetical protein
MSRDAHRSWCLVAPELRVKGAEWVQQVVIGDLVVGSAEVVTRGAAQLTMVVTGDRRSQLYIDEPVTCRPGPDSETTAQGVHLVGVEPSVVDIGVHELAGDRTTLAPDRPGHRIGANVDVGMWCDLEHFAFGVVGIALQHNAISANPCDTLASSRGVGDRTPFEHTPLNATQVADLCAAISGDTDTTLSSYPVYG